MEPEETESNKNLLVDLVAPEDYVFQPGAATTEEDVTVHHAPPPSPAAPDAQGPSDETGVTRTQMQRLFRRSATDLRPTRVVMLGETEPQSNSTGHLLQATGGSNGSHSKTRTLAERTGLEFHPEDWIPTPDWDWLPKRTSGILATLPLEVKEVDRKEQRCACGLWVFLIATFLVYSAVVTWQTLEQRNSPPQSTAYYVPESDQDNKQELMEKLNSLPNVVVCYPSFAGDVDWMPIRTHPFFWKYPDEETVVQSTPLNQDTCQMISRTGKGRLISEGRVTDRGVELYMAYVVNASSPRLVTYRGAILTMTAKSPEAFCNDNVKSQMLQDWQECPFDKFSLESTTFLPFTELEINTRTVTQLKKRYDPIHSTEPEVTQYLFVPRLASYHMGSDRHLQHPDAITILDSIQGLNMTGSTKVFAGVGRFIITQVDAVVSYEETEPFQVLALFGTLAGAWSGILGLFTCVFVSTESGRRRLTAIVRKPYKQIRSWSKKKHLSSTRGSPGSASISVADDETKEASVLERIESQDVSVSGAGVSHKPMSKVETSGSSAVKKPRPEPPSVEQRMGEVEKTLAAVLSESLVSSDEVDELRDHVCTLEHTVSKLTQQVHLLSELLRAATPGPAATRSTINHPGGNNIVAPSAVGLPREESLHS